MEKMEEIMQEALKMKQQENCTQFEITSNLLRNLYKFDLTPITKLVLLELTTHLNEDRNGSVVFPSIGYIAEVLGIGLTAAKKAINDLINQGIIIKTKRNKVKGNYNKYLFTSKITNATIDFKADKNKNRYIYTQKNINGQNSLEKPSENKLFKESLSDLFYIRTNNNEKINNKVDFLKMGGNVYSEDKILRDYAIKHGAKCIDAYVRKLKQTNSAKNIICEYKKKKKYTQIALRSIEETQRRIAEQKEWIKTASDPQDCAAWVELGKKIGIKRIL